MGFDWGGAYKRNFRTPGTRERITSAPDRRNRVRGGVYISPSGKKLPFDFESVARRIPLRRPAFEFPGINDAYVQDNGYGARSYPLACIFAGPISDKLATEFELACIEPGVGKLEHPLYGTFEVIPVGTIERRDDLAQNANESIVVVEFMTTTGAVYPSRAKNAKNEIQAAVDALASVMIASNGISAKTVLAKANLKAKIRALLRQAQGWHDTVTDYNAAAMREFRDVQKLINESLDVLVGDPLLLTRQLINMTTAPGRATNGLISRIGEYAEFARGLVATSRDIGKTITPGLPATSYARQRNAITVANDFRSTDIMVASAISGAASASLTSTFTTRGEALQAALVVATMLDDVQAWREEIFETIEVVDDGAVLQALQSVVGRVAGYLIEASFTLVPERAIVLDRARTIVDLCAELYGTVSSERLDFLISTNALTGDDILELSRGRRIVYYT